jgi:hypothetical protein
MTRSLVAAPLLLALLGAADNAPPATPPTTPQTCVFEPSGPVSIAVGAGEVFSSAEGCSDYSVVLSPADGTAGFSSGTECTLTEVYRPVGVFKVRGCVIGTVTATVSKGGSVLQTITINVGWAS